MLDVSDITFSYHSQAVLEAIAFHLEKGRVLGILGINGAGKSTLLKCLNRILKPESGTVLLEKENLLSMHPQEVARRVGYVPQRHRETRLSVYESVLLGRKPHMGWTVSDADYEIVENILKRMELTHLGLKSLNELSGGELQKVMIARALAQSPKILLLDEPTSNLDLKNQMEVMKLIRSVVREQGLSAIITIHDLNLALRFADTFLFLYHHRVHSLVGKEKLSADIIREVYGVDVILEKVKGQTVVLPL